MPILHCVATITLWCFVFPARAAGPVRAIPHDMKAPPVEETVPGAPPPEAVAPPARKRPSTGTGLCNDLYKFTCAPGEYDDGTGVAFTRDKIGKKVEALKDSQKPTFKAAFLDEIRKNDRFRRRALSGLGLSDSPYCRAGADAAKLKKCDDSLSEGLADVALDRILGSPSPELIRGFGSLEDLDFLINNPVYRRVESALAKRAREKLIDKKAQENIEKTVFPRVQTMLSKLIKASIKDETTRKNMATKVEDIEFAGTDCAEIAGSERQSIHGVLMPNAYYNALENTFKYCNGFFLQNGSMFQIVHTIAHELAHAIDPCHIAVDMEELAFKYSDPKDLKKSEAEFPFEGLLPCLRSEESIGAERRSSDLAPIPDEPPASDTGPAKVAAAPDARPAAPPPDAGDGPLGERSPFCTSRDQIGEAFADRIADEILPAYISTHHSGLDKDQMQIGYSNVFRGICDNTVRRNGGPLHFDEHPDTRDRVNRGLLTHPAIRKQMGCREEPPAGTKHCPLKKEEKK